MIALGWLVGMLILILGLGWLDVPTWYRVTGISVGTLVTLVGLATVTGTSKD